MILLLAFPALWCAGFLTGRALRAYLRREDQRLDAAITNHLETTNVCD